MKKIITSLLFSVFIFQMVTARPVDSSTAKKVARQFLAINENHYGQASLTLCDSWTSPTGDTLMYVFNIDTIGFIIVGANDALPPVMSYSFNGSYRRDKLPENFLGWMENCATDIQAFLSCTALPKSIAEEQETWRKEWNALIQGDNSDYAKKDSKSVQPLIETRWEQGGGYNNYCPEWYNGSNGHCVTGCVATAMAQIIRYHQYPNVGFYHKGYTHPSYGYLYVDFDSAYYDFTKMPISVSRYSPADQQHAVSLLCYHCGVAVKMTYEYEQHISGSGAYSRNVPQGLLYFGYTDCKHLTRSETDAATWDSLLRHDLDLGLPVYYSGSSTSGGHAFVCDGYNSNGYFHFNFGWGGYSDNYYLLTSLNGFSGSQEAVFNIVPSGIASLHDTLYIDANGNGDGSSWASASSNLTSAIKLRGLYSSGKLWIKSGTYYGDTTGNTAFIISPGLKIYGGFNGTESDINERINTTAPTILSGRHKRRVVYGNSLVQSTTLNRLTISEGYSESDGTGVYLNDNMIMEYCTITDCSAPSEEYSAAFVNDGYLYNSIIHNNQCGGVRIDGGKATNNLIVHNAGHGVNGNHGELINCDMVSNTGTGIITDGVNIRNCIVWNNGVSLSDSNCTKITFSAIEGFIDIDSNSNIGISHENRPLQGYAPFFMMPDTTRGPAENLGDWRLSSLSPLVDAGDTVRSGIINRDLDATSRFKNGRIDMGCYEQDPSVSIETPDTPTTLHVYPNPANSVIYLEGAVGNIEIYDMMGRRVMVLNSHSDRTSVDINVLSNGLYLLRNERNSVKFIKK